MADNLLGIPNQMHNEGIAVENGWGPKEIVGADGVPDPRRLDLVSRMGADWYGRTKSADNFTLQRPAGWAR